MKTIEWMENDVVKKDVPEFQVGDTLKINILVKEGDKTRIQVFEGVCIRRRGRGANANFSVVKETHGDIVEKTFPVHTPSIEKISVIKTGKASRSKLYHMRKK